jgi:purine-binding chemotaxis protein CheW
VQAQLSSERIRPPRAGDVLVVEVAGTRCALPLVDVLEVLRAVALTPLPTAPPIVEGVIDVRGEVVPVLDIRRRLGLPPAPVSSAQRLVLATAAGRTVALRVDAIEWITRLAATDIAEPDRIAHGIGWLAGVGRVADALVLVHDLGTFLRQAEAEALDDALTAAAGE